MKNTGKKSLLTIIIFAALCLSTAHAIDYLEGSGHDVSSGFNTGRNRLFYYHNNTDDQHWYGTNKWAVRFNFAAEYPTYPDTRFVLSRVRIYFPLVPSTSVPVTVEVFSDANNLPAALLSTVTSSITSNWMDFELPEQETERAVWVVLTCNTSISGPYVSASLGGGAHSYYWNLNTPTHYFQNFALAGINSELLFSVVGWFETGGFDFELFSFDLKPKIEVSGTVRPHFTIINNSAQSINEALIKLEITSPVTDYAVQDTIHINRTIPPNSEIELTANDPDMLPYTYLLPDFPTQLKVKAELHSEFVETGTMHNNSIIKYYNSFRQEFPVNIVENFVSYPQAMNMLHAQDNFADDALKVINYFPIPADPFYLPSATLRYNWYSLAGLPSSVAGGDSIIAGYIPTTYMQLFNTAVNGLYNQRTFLTQSGETVSFPPPYTSLSVRLTLQNVETHMFNNITDPVLVRQSRFYAALCKKVDLHGEVRSVFNRWCAYADTIGTALDAASTWTKEFSFSVGDIGMANLSSQYEIVYWIQHNTSKQIIYSNVISLQELTANEDNVVYGLPFRFSIAPNPVRSGSRVKFTTSTEHDGILNYSIYNTKGQLVMKNRVALAKGKAFLNDDLTFSSGIYIIKFTLEDKSAGNKKITSAKKFMVYR